MKHEIWDFTNIVGLPMRITLGLLNFVEHRPRGPLRFFRFVSWENLMNKTIIKTEKGRYSFNEKINPWDTWTMATLWTERMADPFGKKASVSASVSTSVSVKAEKIGSWHRKMSIREMSSTWKNKEKSNIQFFHSFIHFFFGRSIYFIQSRLKTFSSNLILNSFKDSLFLSHFLIEQITDTE